MEEALRPVFRIDKAEKKKHKILKKRREDPKNAAFNILEENGEEPEGMSSDSSLSDSALESSKPVTSSKDATEEKARQKLLTMNKRVEELIEVLD